MAEDDGGVRASAVVEAEGEGGAGVVVGGCLGCGEVRLAGM